MLKKESNEITIIILPYSKDLFWKKLEKSPNDEVLYKVKLEQKECKKQKYQFEVWKRSEMDRDL